MEEGIQFMDATEKRSNWFAAFTIDFTYTIVDCLSFE